MTRKATNQALTNTAAAAAGGVAASFVNGVVESLNFIPAQYAPAVPLLVGAALQLQKGAFYQNIGAGMAGVAGAALLGGFLQGLEVGAPALRVDTNGVR